jgi:hypothetical protein
MRYAVLTAAVVALALPAAAQTPENPVDGARPGNVIGTGSSLPAGNTTSNVTPGDTKSLIAPNLPSPSVPAGSPPRAYLEAAQRALTLGRTGEAQQALEEAETRMLDRSVVPSRADVPDEQPGVRDVTDALHALAAGDRARTQQIIAGMLARMGG